MKKWSCLFLAAAVLLSIGVVFCEKNNKDDKTMTTNQGGATIPGANAITVIRYALC